MKKIFLPFTVLLITLNLNAQFMMTGVPPFKQDTIHSEVVGEDYYLQITLPLVFNPAKQKYPVLFYLDAFGTSAGMNELAKSKMFSGRFEQFIMVGISYNANPLMYGKLRERDYSPPLSAEDIEHGGDKFLKFIKSELIPHMESNYGTDLNDRGILGASAGGLFATWAFKQEPELFSKLALISPALWYGGDQFILEDPIFLKNIENAKDLDVFIAYGSLEGKDFISHGDKLYNAFKSNENIRVQKVIFEDEDHGSVWNAASSRALHTFYQDAFKAAVKEVDKLYYNGRYKEAASAYELVFEKFPKKVDDGNRYDLACLYALSGNSDSAFEYLNNLNMEYRDWPEKMNRDPDLKSLHDDARWNTVLKSLKRE